MAKQKIVDYKMIRDSIQTLDVLDCRSNNFFLRFIGHTATVYRDSTTDMLHVLESTQYTWTGINGVQVTPMGLWLFKYPGKVFLRRVILSGHYLAKHKSLNRALISFKIKQFIKKYRGTSYPNVRRWRGRMRLFRAWWDGIFTGKNKQNAMVSLFCTQLVAMAFQWVKLMYPGANPSELIPKDITKKNGKFHKELLNCKLSGPIRIK